MSREAVARQLRHRAGLSDKDVIDPKAETQFGRFALSKVITQEQYDAGTRWRGVVMAYRSVIEAPSAFPKSIAGAVTGGGGGRGHISDDEALRRKSVYNEGYEAVMEYCGMAGMRTLNDATVHERHVEPRRLLKLREALDVLVGLAYQGRRRVG
jgi:hypothetical protein